MAYDGPFPITLADGGTNANLTASNGGIFYSTGSAGAILAGTATARQLLLSGASTTPAWSTSTYPTTNAINTLLYASAANVMSALATANNGVLTTGTSGTPVITALGTDGQVIIGSSAGAPAAATLTAGTGISITNGHNSITINSSGSSTVSWSDQSGNFNAAKQNGYFCTAALTATLPASPSEGDTIAFVCTTTAIVIGANTGQVITLGNTSSTSAGTCTNIAAGDSITLVYRSTGTTWWATQSVGNWTLA